MSATDDASSLLEFRDLSVSFAGSEESLEAVRRVSFHIPVGARVGLVGESGCGKTVTAMSILRLLPQRTTRSSGKIILEGQDILAMDDLKLREIRGGAIGMVFQEPMTALDPVFTIGDQIAETLKAHRVISSRAAREQAVDALAAVGLSDPGRRADQFPHELSGGMRQRVVIAMAMICKPRLLIADEPTTALDVTVQAQIMRLIARRSEDEGTAVLLVSHDLALISQFCDRVVVMYAGEVIEQGGAHEVLSNPRHPYTSALLRSQPQRSVRKADLPAIPGRVPTLRQMPRGCRFAGRCRYAESACTAQEQPILFRTPTHAVRCFRSDELLASEGLQ